MPDDKFLDKLDAVEKAALENNGKVNHNPYYYIRDAILPLRVAYGKNKGDKATQDAILALPAAPDTRCDKTIPDKKTVLATQVSLPRPTVAPPKKSEEPPATPPQKDKEG